MNLGTSFQEIPADRIRSGLESILNREEYDYLREEPTWLEETIEEAFLAVVEFFENLDRDSPFLYTLTLIFIALVAALLIWHIAYTFRTALAEDRFKARVDKPGERRDSSHALRQRAEGSARVGRYLEAVRLCLASAVALVEERLDCGSLSGKTNREVLRLSSALESVQDPLSALITEVEEIWFGRHDADAGDFNRCRRYFEEVWNHA